MSARRSCGSLLGMALGALVVSGPAQGELYRCVGPDGRAVFTDQKSACPGAESYEPSGRITNTDTPPRAATPAARSRALAADPGEEEQRAAHWRQKKLDAEQVIENVVAKRASLKPFVSHCNRGGYITARDDAGIKRRVNCSQLKQEFAALDDEEAKARDYLENGLPEECRKSGCLPGWIR